VIELFEVAHVYLPRASGLPDEQRMLALTSGADFLTVKGVIESIVARLDRAATVVVADHPLPLCEAGRSVQLSVGGESLGYLGEVSPAGLKRFELRGASTIAELKLSVLERIARLTPQYQEQPPFPTITRDLNLVVDEQVSWRAIADVVRASGGSLLVDLAYESTYRDAERLGAGKKSILLSIKLRDPAATLTSAQADAVCQAIVTQAASQLGAQLRA
jgi:phenylalanyl-tRNA synthetase beta chain